MSKLSLVPELEPELARRRRAIGVERVSRLGERDEIPADYREKIEALCEAEGLELLRVESEPNVSGRAPLVKRHGLLAAIEAVEAREADVIVFPYFDRFVRSLRV